MASMTVRNIPDDVHRRVRVLAAERGMSTEAMVREILREATEPPIALGDTIAAFARQSGEDFPEITRDTDPLRPAVFE